MKPLVISSALSLVSACLLAGLSLPAVAQTEDGAASSGRLLRRPEIYCAYRVSGSPYHTFARETMSTLDDHVMSDRGFLGYSRVLETTSRPSSADAVSMVEYVFSDADSGMRSVYTSPRTDMDDHTGWWISAGPLTGTGPVPSDLYAYLNGMEPGSLGGRLLERTEYDGALSRPVVSESHSYSDVSSGSMEMRTSAMGYFSGHLLVFPSPRERTTGRTEYDSDTHSEVISSRDVAMTYDALGRLSGETFSSSSGESVETEYAYDAQAPTRLSEVRRSRDGRTAWGERCSYLRPAPELHPDWYVPERVSRDSVTMSPSGIPVESWATAAVFSDFNAAGLPCTLVDAEGSRTRFTWDADLVDMASRTVETDSLSGASLTDTWTWIQLVGMSGHVGPSGVSMSYSYSDDGRLLAVDRNGRTVERHAYNAVNGGTAGLPEPGVSLSSDHSWITSTMVNADSLGTQTSATEVQYLDALGFESQTRRVGASTGGLDIVTPRIRDALMRESSRLLPFASGGSGTWTAGALTAQRDWYAERYGDDDGNFASSYDRMEQCPSGRVKESFLPGYVMNEHGGEVHYVANAAGSVMDIRHDAAAGTISSHGTYPAGSLRGERRVDADGRTLTTWTDNEGRTVRTDAAVDTATVASTLYVYDWRGNLSWVIQPEGAARIADELSSGGGSIGGDSEFARKWCFVYTHDGMGNVAGRSIPGRGTEILLHDGMGRVVRSSDAVQRRLGEHMEYAYDGAGRELSRTLAADGSASTDPVVLLRTEYDAYTHGETPVPDGVYTDGTAVAAPGGLMTFEELAVLDTTDLLAAGAAEYVRRHFWYDADGNLVQRLEVHPDGSSVRESFGYDLQGNVTARRETAAGPDGDTHWALTRSTYDVWNRLTSCSRTVDGQTMSPVAFSYDELGRLRSKTSGSLVSETYARDIRGWTAGISACRGADSLFSETLRYIDPLSPQSEPQYSGNISETRIVMHGSLPDVRSYRYDGLSRLTDSRRFTGDSMQPTDEDVERGITYDLDGNILSMSRNVSGSSLEIGMSYLGNRLHRSVMTDGYGSESVMEYAYDEDGNRISGSRDGLEFRYNLANLPSESALRITVEDMDTGETYEETEMRVVYRYLSDGTKLSSMTDTGEGLGYLGPFVYAVDGQGSVSLESLSWEEGRVTAGDGGALRDLWFVKDHLGNVRSVLDLSAPSSSPLSQVILEQDGYLPFGTRIGQGPETDNRYRYAGKEEQSFGTSSSELLDFGARYYDPWTCQWTGIDPMAEKCLSFSPYVYCGGNPINRIDFKGQNDFIFDSRGNFTVKKTKDSYDRIIMSNGSSMIVKDRSLLNNMSTKRYYEPTSEGDLVSRTLVYTTVGYDCSELVSIFGFLQDNSSVEWGLYHGKSGRSLLGTTKDSDIVRVDVLIEYDKRADYKNKSFPYDSKIHGHPGVDDSHVISSMEMDIINTQQNPEIQSYVYFPLEKQIYRVTTNIPKRVYSYKNWSPK